MRNLLLLASLFLLVFSLNSATAQTNPVQSQDTSDKVTITKVAKAVWTEYDTTWVEVKDPNDDKKLLGGQAAGGLGGAVIGFLCGGPIGAAAGLVIGQGVGAGSGAIATNKPTRVPRITSRIVNGYQISLDNGQILCVNRYYKKGQRVSLTSIDARAVIK